jgi:hypothetical protein
MAVSIAVLGDRNVEYLTHRELDASLALLPDDVDARWLPSPDAAASAAADGLWVVPGTPYRDGDAVLDAIRFARTGGMAGSSTCWSSSPGTSRGSRMPRTPRPTRTPPTRS